LDTGLISKISYSRTCIVFILSFSFSIFFKNTIIYRTNQFFIFDNSYYKELDDENASEELLKMSSDKAVFKDDDFRPYAMKFRNDQTVFFDAYKKAHKKLSELGSNFIIGNNGDDHDSEPIILDRKNEYGQKCC